jgi:hypothetical protein
MVDSGGQYLDGTTDVTRTFHYGTPTQEQVVLIIMEIILSKTVIHKRHMKNSSIPHQDMY